MTGYEALPEEIRRALDAASDVRQDLGCDAADFREMSDRGVHTHMFAALKYEAAAMQIEALSDLLEREALSHLRERQRAEALQRLLDARDPGPAPAEGPTGSTASTN